jgi:hypothetical protein
MPEPTFNAFNWHNSRVLKIELDLDLNEDELFEILFQLIEDCDTLKTSWKRMKLRDCREIRIKGHLGFRRGNSISEEMAEIDSVWGEIAFRSAQTGQESLFSFNAVPQISQTRLPSVFTTGELVQPPRF